MKKYLYMAGLFLTMTFTACDDFLSVSSPDKMTTDKFWRDVTDAESTLASAYSQLYHGDAWATSEVRWPVEEFRSDMMVMGTDAINYQNWTDLYNFTWTNGNTQFSYYYQDLYRGINFANQVLEFTPKVPEGKITEAKRSEIIAEGHFLRGYYHMMLLLNWERIIIRDSYITDESGLNKPLSDRTACWDFVINELKQATTLPAERNSEETGRATCGAVNSYLGFAYLTRAYEEPESETEHLASALSALNEVKGYELVSGDDLVNMFNGHNKNCKESIFEVQYSLSTDNGASFRSCIHQWMLTAELEGWDEIAPSTKLIDEFKKEGKTSVEGTWDQRLYNTIYFKDDYWNTGNKIYGKNYDDWFTTDRPVFRRFTPIDDNERKMSRCAFNIPLMRYANVLLMKAEVLNKQGHPGQAIPIINNIRAKHGNMPAMTGKTQSEVQAQIEHERAIEFPLEGYRWYDLRRWGKLTEAVGSRGFVESKHSFYPIPLWEENANGNLNGNGSTE